MKDAEYLERFHAPARVSEDMVFLGEVYTSARFQASEGKNSHDTRINRMMIDEQQTA